MAGILNLPARDSATDASQFQYVRGLDYAQINALLDAANLGGLADFLYEGVLSLSEQSASTAAQLNDKFSTTAKFQMTYGSLSLFYGGLESLLGPPKMVRGSLLSLIHI